MDIFNPLLNNMKSVSASIKDISNNPDKEISDLEIDTTELMDCGLGLRSTTVLASLPKLLEKCVVDKSSSFRVLLAHA